MAELSIDERMEHRSAKGRERKSLLHIYLSYEVEENFCEIVEIFEKQDKIL